MQDTAMWLAMYQHSGCLSCRQYALCCTTSPRGRWAGGHGSGRRDRRCWQQPGWSAIECAWLQRQHYWRRAYWNAWQRGEKRYADGNRCCGAQARVIRRRKPTWRGTAVFRYVRASPSLSLSASASMYFLVRDRASFWFAPLRPTCRLVCLDVRPSVFVLRSQNN